TVAWGLGQQLKEAPGIQRQIQGPPNRNQWPPSWPSARGGHVRSNATVDRMDRWVLNGSELKIQRLALALASGIEPGLDAWEILGRVSTRVPRG
ncbi:hypothetical protein BGZ49_005104, partial [Haplosporangium sp. Z 27]